MEKDRKGEKEDSEENEREYEEYDEEKLKERERALMILKERRKQRDAERQLLDTTFGDEDEEDPDEREARRKQRDLAQLRRLEEIVKQKKNKGTKAVSVKLSDAALNPFKLYKKSDYTIKIPVYFCDMIMKSPPAGEVARFFENFKSILFDINTSYPNFPILFLDRFHSAPDLKALLALIDIQDSGGFTALHWAVQSANVEQVEMLLANGANTELKSYAANHTPIDKLKTQPPHVRSAIQELFQKYQGLRDNNNNNSKNIPIKQDQHSEEEMIEKFPFLELPTELQIMVLEHVTVYDLTRVQRVCKYLRHLQILQRRLADLPDMEIVTFGSNKPPNYVEQQQRCQLIVMATPTVFHFGTIVGQKYTVPTKRGVKNVVNELIGRIKMFAKTHWPVYYDIEKLQSFLVNSLRMNRRIYVLQQTDKSDVIAIYVEEDSHFGVGVEFKSPSTSTDTLRQLTGLTTVDFTQ